MLHCNSGDCNSGMPCLWGMMTFEEDCKLFTQCCLRSVALAKRRGATAAVSHRNGVESPRLPVVAHGMGSNALCQIQICALIMLPHFSICNISYLSKFASFDHKSRQVYAVLSICAAYKSPNCWLLL